MGTNSPKRLPLDHVKPMLSHRDILCTLDELADEKVTAEELAAFDDAAFDTTGIEIPPEISDPACFFELLDSVEGSTPAADEATPIRTVVPQGSGSDEPQFSDLMDLVIQAYLDVREMQSLEYMLVEPSRNLAFVQRCWQLGGVGGPADFNWLLLNARKSSKLRGLPRPRRFSLPRRRFEELSFASEIALRHIQDRFFLEQQRRISLDKLLCDPKLTNQYDAFVQKQVGAVQVLESRWTAIALRKARKTVPARSVCPSLDDVGTTDDVRVSNLPPNPGVFWFRAPDYSVFVGVTTNLRRHLDQLIGTAGPTVVPDWFDPHHQTIPRLAVLETAHASTSEREKLRSTLLRHHGSRLNFFLGNLLDRQAQAG